MMSEQKPVMKSISDALGMAPLVIDAEVTPADEASVPAVVVEPLEVEVSVMDQEAEEDFALVRGKSRDLIEKAEEALDGILRIASGSEHPRAFEVAANLLKTASDLQAGLLKLHEQRRQLVPDPDAGKKADAPTTQTNNQYNFYGSTQEFLDKVEALEKERAEKNGTFE
jgi:hypothetical protein